MMTVTRQDDYPMELSAELIQYLESLPGTIVFQRLEGDVLVFRNSDKSTGRVNKSRCGSGARSYRPGARSGAQRR